MVNAPDLHEQSADERDQQADLRERAADEREMVADLRDQAADERDIAADLRDQAANGRAVHDERLDHEYAAHDHAEDVRHPANRDESAHLRAKSAQDRKLAKEDRADALDDLRNPSESNLEDAQVRDTQAEVRDAAADKRDTRQEARDIQSAALDQSHSDRFAQVRERGVEVRESATDDRDMAAQDRSKSSEDREVAAGERAALTWRVKRDDLTGLINRAELEGHVKEAIQGVAGPSGASVVMFCDIDHFKEVNDGHGHSVGDEVLRLVSARIVGAVRSNDLVARVGGDEFVVLSGSPVSTIEAAELAERVRRAIAEPMSLGIGDVTVTVSIGVAQAGQGAGVQELIGRADAALYDAKQAGRNQVSTAKPRSD